MTDCGNAWCTVRHMTEPKNQPRERSVPCKRDGCTNVTMNWDRVCDNSHVMHRPRINFRRDMP